MRRLIQALAVATAATVTLGLVATPGHARTEVSRERVPYAFFYDNIVTAEGEPANTLILFAGGSPQQRCHDDPLPLADLRIQTKGSPPEDGATIRESFVERGGLWLHDGGGLQAPEFLDQYCEASFGEGDVPETIGVGMGTVRAETSVDFVGPGAGVANRLARTTVNAGAQACATNGAWWL